MDTQLIRGMPPGLRGPHIDSEGPCNNPACRKCDPVRAAMYAWAMKQLRHNGRKAKVRK